MTPEEIQPAFVKGTALIGFDLTKQNDSTDDLDPLYVDYLKEKIPTFQIDEYFVEDDECYYFAGISGYLGVYLEIAKLGDPTLRFKVLKSKHHGPFIGGKGIADLE